MKFIADLHIHSHYSLATSKQLTPEYLDYWAKRKGINVVGTGDFTHPGWLNELQEKLEPAEEGLYRLKPEYELEGSKRLKGEVRFLLTTEISNIYKKNGKVRKVHSVIFTPDFSTAGKFQAKLRQMNFNITSDGRPIIGMDAKKLLELTLDVSRHNFFIPAHIWTPWFSILGAKSGFDSVQECFEDLSEHIYAVETGLSTDPPMNWICSFLDKYNLVSNSDAHSPEKLGRNANIFNTELSYFQIIEALKDLSGKKFTGTIDMFPQEGKYHYDGHRKCGVCWNPVETLEHAGICSHCGKKVTIGVTNRVTQLSDRENILERKNRNLFHSLIPLKEILAEIRGTNPGTKTIDKEYHRILEKTGTEFDVLLHLSKEELLKAGGTLLAEAIIRMRNKEVYIAEGFDGEYGRIKVFADGEIGRWGSSQGMFTDVADEIPKPPTRALLNFDLKRYRELSLQPLATETWDVAEEKEGYGTNLYLNPEPFPG